MRGRDGTDTSYETDTLNIGPGESFDVIFTAPPTAGARGYDTYLLYNRTTRGRTTWRRAASVARPPRSASTRAASPPQQYPNDWGV